MPPGSASVMQCNIHDNEEGMCNAHLLRPSVLGKLLYAMLEYVKKYRFPKITITSHFQKTKKFIFVGSYAKL